MEDLKKKTEVRLRTKETTNKYFKQAQAFRMEFVHLLRKCRADYPIMKKQLL